MILQLNEDDCQKRMEYEAREKAIRDYNAGMTEAKERGISIGEERGEKKGRLSVAKNMPNNETLAAFAEGDKMLETGTGLRFEGSTEGLLQSLASSEEKSYEKRLAGFQGLISFAGTLPEDFDYKKELEEARDEKLPEETIISKEGRLCTQSLLT